MRGERVYSGDIMKSQNEQSQTMQRVKVGMIGLAAIVLLIALASAIIGSASRDRPVATAGGAQPTVVANMAIDNLSDAGGEPLAEMGVAPGVNAQAPR